MSTAGLSQVFELHRIEEISHFLPPGCVQPGNGAIKAFIVFSRSGLGNRATARFSLRLAFLAVFFVSKKNQPGTNRGRHHSGKLIYGACFRPFLGCFLQHFINLSCCSFSQHLRQRYSCCETCTLPKTCTMSASEMGIVGYSGHVFLKVRIM